MANRSIRTEIWNDDIMEDKRPLDRLLYVYLLTNDRTHICGFYKLNLATIGAETGMTKAQILASMEKLTPKVFYLNGWVCIKNYRNYQSGGGEKIDTAIENELKRVPKEILDRVSDFPDTLIVNTNTDMNANRGSVRGNSERPTLEEVRAYCLERKNRIDAEQFMDFYTSKGWKVGNQPMKDWKAAVRTWEKRNKSDPPPNKICVTCKKDASAGSVLQGGAVICTECFGGTGRNRKYEGMKAKALINTKI